MTWFCKYASNFPARGCFKAGHPTSKQSEHWVRGLGDQRILFENASSSQIHSQHQKHLKAQAILCDFMRWEPQFDGATAGKTSIPYLFRRHAPRNVCKLYGHRRKKWPCICLLCCKCRQTIAVCRPCVLKLSLFLLHVVLLLSSSPHNGRNPFTQFKPIFLRVRIVLMLSVRNFSSNCFRNSWGLDIFLGILINLTWRCQNCSRRLFLIKNCSYVLLCTSVLLLICPMFFFSAEQCWYV